MSAIDKAQAMVKNIQSQQTATSNNEAVVAHAEHSEAAGMDKKNQPLDFDSDLILRTANILDPRYTYKDSTIDVLNISGVVNDSTGKVCLAWDDLPGGIIKPAAKGQKSNEELISYNPSDRTYNQIINTSDAEIVPLTYPFLWSGSVNWCGINYLPPVGAKALIGWRKDKMPAILGYLNMNYRHTEPPLRPGEIMIKGFGDNYIHQRWSNKMDLRCHANSGDQDRDDSSGSKTANADCECKISIDADNGFIELSVNGNGIRISADSITQIVKGSSISVDENNITFTSPKSITNNTSAMNNNYAEANHNK